VPALGWGSVVGNTLERGWGYTPQGEHSAQQCGMEVVLADGDVVRTGMGAIEGSSTWQLFKGGFGPSLDGLFMQSNLGIVTKMGMWMMARPDCYRGCEVKVAREADLAPLVDVLSRLRRRDILQNNAIIGNVVRWAAISGARTRWYDGDGAMPDEVLERIRAELGLGWWDATFGLYGPEELVDARWEIVQRELAAIDGAEVTSRRYTGVDGEGVDAAQVAADGGRATECGVPGLAALTILGFRGEDCGHLGFSPILPPSGEQALRFHELQRRRSAEHGFDVFAGLHVYGRHVCHINLIIFDRHDAAQRANARRAFEALVHDAHELGHSEYRAHVAFMDLVSDQYDWGGHALRRTHERLKDALDADGILSPGKQGVWPASLRPSGEYRS
jgi:4-cresol dehydrogenase (hydroxylating) flavoprotein subunit